MTFAPNCESCGKFCRPVAWQMVYTRGAYPEPDREVYRCRKCFDKYGPFLPDDRIRPEASCGLIPSAVTHG